MALAFPSSQGVFVPSHKATAGLMAGFSRDPKAFPLNRYAQVIQVDKPIGYWATWNSKQAAKVRSVNLSEYLWRDGQVAATGQDNVESFGFTKFETFRYAFPFTLGDMTIKTADWGILQAHADMAAQQAMTGRTLFTYGVWGSATNWGTHCANVDGVAGNLNGNAPILASGANWTNGSDGKGTNNPPYIKKTFNKVRRQIQLDTLAVIKPSEVAVTINPTTAMAMAESPEVHSYLASSVYAKDVLLADGWINQDYGIPDRMYGSEIIIEDTVWDSVQGPGSADGFVVPDGEALFSVRKGGLEGIGGGPAHATIVIFYFEDDLTVESYHDVNNRMTQGRVVTNFTSVITINTSGYYLRHAIG